MHPELIERIKKHKVEFKIKFGREPGPGDPLFFDPDSDTPIPYSAEKLNREIIETMRKAGIPGELIYIFEKTGFILDEEGYRRLSPEDREEYDDAVETYRKKRYRRR